MLRVIEVKLLLLGLRYYLDIIVDLDPLVDLYIDQGYFDKAEATLTQVEEYRKAFEGDSP